MKYPLPLLYRNTLPELGLDSKYEFEYQEHMTFPGIICRPNLTEEQIDAFAKHIFSYPCDPETNNLPRKFYKNTKAEMIKNELSFCDVLYDVAIKEIANGWKTSGDFTRSHYWFISYEQGSIFEVHSDNAWNGINNIVTYPDRKFTGVFYFYERGDNYDGGELIFDDIIDAQGNPLKISPNKGELILFPANIYFRHHVTEIKKGKRLIHGFTIDVL